MSDDDDAPIDVAALKAVHFSEVGPERRMPSWIAPRKEPPKKRKAAQPTVKEVAPEVSESIEEPMPASRPAGRSVPPPRAPERPSLRAGELEALQLERAALRDATSRVEGDITAALNQLVLAREGMERRCVEQMVELIEVIAERVIGREVRSDPTFVVGIVREALKVLSKADTVSVRLGPALSEAQGTLQTQFSGSGLRLQCQIDTSLEPFGCVVETELGRVDESVRTRLRTLLEASGIATEESITGEDE